MQGKKGKRMGGVVCEGAGDFMGNVWSGGGGGGPVGMGMANSPIINSRVGA